MSFKVGETDIANIFDTRYPGDQTTGFTVDGIDIGTIYTPAVSGFTTDTETGYKINNGDDLNTLFSSSTPTPTVTINNAISGVDWDGNPDFKLYTFGGDNGSFSIYVPFDNMDVSPIDIVLVGGGGSGGAVFNWYEGGGGGGGGGVLLSTIPTEHFSAAGTYTFSINCGQGGSPAWGVEGSYPGVVGGTSSISLTYNNDSNIKIMEVYGGGGGGGRNTYSENRADFGFPIWSTLWTYLRYYGSLTVDNAQGAIANLGEKYASSGGVMNGFPIDSYTTSVASSAAAKGDIGWFASGYGGSLHGSRGGMSYVAGGGGGGGGAGQAGADTQITSASFTNGYVTGLNIWTGTGGTNANGGNGGDGYQWITGNYYGGGGGGGDTIAPGGNFGTGGKGGGGPSGGSLDGTALTGGGGSAGFGQLPSLSYAGSGGSGVCLIAFTNPDTFNIN